MIPARDYTTVSDMLAGYAGVRKRLLAPKTTAQKPRPRVINYRVRPLWMRSSIMFNAHVIAWQLRNAAKAMSPIPLFIARWCKENNTTVQEMTGRSRLGKVVAIRHRLIWAVHSSFEVSLPQLGRMFGDRDHTTILNSLKRGEQLAGGNAK